VFHVLDRLQRLGVSDELIAKERASLDETRFRVAFVGEWNSGKSTLINLFLDKPVVPVGRYPETGAACFIHLAASAEVTASWSDGRIESGQGSIEKIRDWVQITRNGSRANVASLPSSIDIATPGIDLPSSVDIIDTPGLNDDPEMIDRALAASANADAIVFVLNTRHFLTSVEAETVRALVKQPGRAGILFVLNVFLDCDSQEEWLDRMEEDLPIQRSKLRNLLDELGCVPEGDLVSVSARAASESFGADLFRDAVKRLWSEGIREQMVEGRRSATLRRLLTRANEIANQKLRSLEAEFAKANRAHQDFKQRRKRGENYKRISENAVDDAIETWASNAKLVAISIASRLTTSNLTRDDTYSKELTTALADIGRQAADELYSNLKNISSTYQQRDPGSTEERTIGNEFAFGTIEVPVPNYDAGSGGVLAGAAAGAALGSVFPIIGTFFGGVLGGIAGAVHGADAAMERDVAGARSSIQGAINEAVEEMSRRRESLLEISESLQEKLVEVRKPVRAAIDRWHGLVSEIEQLL
jgi:Dynamin family